jgi:hypothetical protein
MIDLGFAVILAMLAAGVGWRSLSRLSVLPDHPLDALALSVPLGLGVIALGTLVLGEIGWLDRTGLCVLFLGLITLAAPSSKAILKAFGGMPGSRTTLFGSIPWPCRVVAILTAAAVVATAVASTLPVTDGDALCYHLQVPKVFLERASVGFAPDLHETVYPLVTELLYAVALALRGPIACRCIQWVLGLVFAANVIALARPTLGDRAWLAGAIAILTPAISNGMTAPLNDVALAAFAMAALFAWVRMRDCPAAPAAVVAGTFGGLALGVKYPALVFCGLLSLLHAIRIVVVPFRMRKPWLLAGLAYVAVMIAVGGCWYLRAYAYTGNPVFPYFRQLFGNAGLDEVLDPIKRPLSVTPSNVIAALGPMTLAPDRFDSFSHQFGPMFLLFLPGLVLERAPRRILGLVGLGYLFLMICVTQRQSMRFVLTAVGPMSIGIGFLADRWMRRSSLAPRLLIALLIVILGFESSLAIGRARHGIKFALGHESESQFLERVEPTYRVGKWAAANLPRDSRVIGQDHRGFYIPRDYTMELAHRRRTGLGARGESAEMVIERLRNEGFTHLLFCPPVPETAVEFDPALGRILAPWLVHERPLYRQELADIDGVVRRYAIYDLSRARLTAHAERGVAR